MKTELITYELVKVDGDNNPIPAGSLLMIEQEINKGLGELMSVETASKYLGKTGRATPYNKVNELRLGGYFHSVFPEQLNGRRPEKNGKVFIPKYNVDVFGTSRKYANYEGVRPITVSKNALKGLEKEVGDLLTMDEFAKLTDKSEHEIKVNTGSYKICGLKYKGDLLFPRQEVAYQNEFYHSSNFGLEARAR